MPVITAIIGSAISAAGTATSAGLSIANSFQAAAASRQQARKEQGIAATAQTKLDIADRQKEQQKRASDAQKIRDTKKIGRGIEGNKGGTILTSPLGVTSQGGKTVLGG